MSYFQIKAVHAREILDSRGWPTAEVDLNLSYLQGMYQGRASIPSGASTGEGEALEIRDQDTLRFLGKGVLKAIENIHTRIFPALISQKFKNLKDLDSFLCLLDGSENKSVLGANATLAISLATTRALANAQNLPLFSAISQLFLDSQAVLEKWIFPVPLLNFVNGGKHANNNLQIQEFMIVPFGFSSFRESIRAGVEIFQTLKNRLQSRHQSTAVGDEGGFAPNYDHHENVFQDLMSAIETAGYQPGKNVMLALDCASSEFYKKPGSYQFENQNLTANQMVDIYSNWIEKYPIFSIEDGLAENDWKGWEILTRRLGQRCQLVGDDLFVTRPQYLKKGIESQCGDSILIKLNQIGTLSETLETMRIAHGAGYSTIVSHRSGETEDHFIADLAVGTGCGQIKTGSVCRSERTAKFNQLIRIEEELTKKNQALFAGSGILKQALS